MRGMFQCGEIPLDLCALPYALLSSSASYTGGCSRSWRAGITVDAVAQSAASWPPPALHVTSALFGPGSAYVPSIQAAITGGATLDKMMRWCGFTVRGAKDSTYLSRELTGNYSKRAKDVTAVTDGALLCVLGIVEATTPGPGLVRGASSSHVGVLCVHTAGCGVEGARVNGKDGMSEPKGSRPGFSSRIGGRTTLTPFEALAARRAAAAIAGVFAAAADAKCRHANARSASGRSAAISSRASRKKITEELAVITSELAELKPLKHEMEARIGGVHPGVHNGQATVTEGDDRGGGCGGVGGWGGRGEGGIEKEAPTLTQLLQGVPRPDGAMILVCYLAFIVMRGRHIELPDLGIETPGMVHRVLSGAAHNSPSARNRGLHPRENMRGRQQSGERSRDEGYTRGYSMDEQSEEEEEGYTRGCTMNKQSGEDAYEAALEAFEAMRPALNAAPATVPERGGARLHTWVPTGVHTGVHVEVHTGVHAGVHAGLHAGPTVRRHRRLDSLNARMRCADLYGSDGLDKALQVDWFPHLTLNPNPGPYSMLGRVERKTLAPGRINPSPLDPEP